MALQTPRARQGGVRPSLLSTNINTASSPNLLLPSSTAIARKASLNALTGQSPDNVMHNDSFTDLQVGDIVDVPGGMFGTVKFVGAVKGKKGSFAGVELNRDFASRGKNDGDVEGVRYFTTSVPGSGIFLPTHRATRRPSVTASDGSFPPTPTTPFLANNFGLGSNNAIATQTPPLQKVPQFSKSVGPGVVRPSSPLSKMRTPRPSLSRPESPMRKPPALPPPPSQRPSMGGPSAFSKSQIGGPRFSPSPVPRPASPGKTKTPVRPYSRSNSRAGQTKPDIPTAPLPTIATRSSDGSGAGTKSANSSSPGIASGNRGLSNGLPTEVQELRKALQEKDQTLKDQAMQLAEMESSLNELQSLLPTMGSPARKDEDQSGDATQLRAVIREKNEKISALTADFDTHRADFRSTIDTLEMASSETARVYEQRIEELMDKVHELEEGREDVEGITRQFKQLEELVSDLEEGLEDARRGEAEARAEVEFLRGENERGRIELQREREQSASRSLEAASAGALDSREHEQLSDEIRGLKAIIHSMSSGADIVEDRSSPQRHDSRNGPEATKMQSDLDRLEKEKRELQTLVERKVQREDELEREIDRLRGNAMQRTSVVSNGMSDRTILQEPTGKRSSKGTVVNWRDSKGIKQELPAMPEITSSAPPSSNGSGVLWCEICESPGHDILTCNSMDKASGLTSHHDESNRFRNQSINLQDPDRPKPLSLGSGNSINKKLPLLPNLPSLPPLPGAAPTAPLPNPMDGPLVAGKDGSQPDPNKWCALCERDGHDSINCAFEDQY